MRAARRAFDPDAFRADVEAVLDSGEFVSCTSVEISMSGPGGS
jgi:hypothetical protein